jgi:hypothetical protein
MTAPNPPLRPATPIDVELAKPHPDEMTDLERRRDEAERDVESDERGRPAGKERRDSAEVPSD